MCELTWKSGIMQNVTVANQRARENVPSVQLLPVNPAPQLFYAAGSLTSRKAACVCAVHTECRSASLDADNRPETQRRFRQSRDLVRESEMFVKDKAKIAGRVSGIKRSVLYSRKD